jgi:hypothetical protein
MLTLRFVQVKVTNFTELKEGQTIDMMQMAAVVGANIE